LQISLLDKTHIRTNFECEEPSLTDYIKTQASQDIKRKLAACFVMADENLQVLAYYTLSSHSLGREQIPAKYLKKLPSNYHAPVILLGRLARDLKVKGKGFGEYLLLDALYRAYELSKSSLGAMAVVVDPINKVAEDFYRSYGFVLLPDSQKMFLPMNVIKQLK
tara:strand:- start:91 stop:582 length:492 start_codon:yes stop_codon:yes gene_type:complete